MPGFPHIVVTKDGHVTLAWGRDYGDVSPLRGLILGGGGNALHVEVDIEPLDVCQVAIGLKSD